MKCFLFCDSGNSEWIDIPVGTTTRSVIPSFLGCTSISDEENFYWYALSENFCLLSHNTNDGIFVGKNPPTKLNGALMMCFEGFPVLGDAYVVKLDNETDELVPFSFDEMMGVFDRFTPYGSDRK
jgi:hypothetical protein